MKRVLRSIYGQYVGTVDDFRMLAQQGIITGQWGNQMPQGDLLNYVNFDDFDGAALLGTWQVAKGSDGAAANFAYNGGLNGTILGTTGAGAGATMAVNGIQIAAHLNLKGQGVGAAASTNNLEFNTRVQMSAITNQVVFVGFTNQVASLQMPINGAGGGNGFTVNANDAVGFLFDTTMTTANWWVIGAKGGVAAAGQNSGFAPVAATYDQFAISVDQLGNATFFRNGAQVGVTMANAITPTVAVTPVIAAFARAAASRTVTVDYIMASMNRI
jgi:hypothetical protein